MSVDQINYNIMLIIMMHSSNLLKKMGIQSQDLQQVNDYLQQRKQIKRISLSVWVEEG